MEFRVTIERPKGGEIERHYAATIRRLERAAVVTSGRLGVIAINSIRTDMQGAGLGRLGNAIGIRSDKAIHRGSRGSSASSVIFVRSKSPRSRGAIESYTEGSEILPVRSRWLWIPTPDVQRLAGSGGRRQRVTPGNWQQFGLDAKIGPLVRVRGANGYPLLVVKNVGVSAAGKTGSARSLTKRGTPRRGQVQRDFVVAFIAIPRTSRAARVDIVALVNAAVAQAPTILGQTLGGLG